MQPDMDVEVWVSVPSYFNSSFDLQKDNGGKTYHEMLKNIPGSPQGSRLWNAKIHKDLTEVKFDRQVDDSCLYRYKDSN